MRRSLAAFIAASLSLTAAAAPQPTVDELIGKCIAARGGIDNLRKVRSMRVTGHLLMGSDGSMKAEQATLYARPAMTRSETTFGGMTAVSAFDGKEAWNMVPFQGRREPQRLSAEEAKSYAHNADIDGPLVDYRAKGNQVELLGTEDVDGTQAWKIRVVRKDGDLDYVYLDPDSFLPIRESEVLHIRGVEMVAETDFGGYRKVAGVWMPFNYDMGGKNEPRTSHYAVDKIEVDVATDPALFHFPAAGTRVERMVTAAANAAETPASAAPPSPATPAVFDEGVLSGLGARNIGSAAMSGRVAAVAATVENGRTTLYVGAASGGVWKSRDGGTTFQPVFDKQPVQSIGAITIDPKNPKIVWVGSGEAWTRNSTSVGDGIYKSTDAGETWTHMGLPSSERIVRIVVSPKDGNTVYACVPGKLWSDSADRGLYKTTDGGKSWSLILKGANPSTGCSSVAMDPTNPDVLLAGLWDFRRKGWTFRSGGDGPDAPSGSAMYRSTDGGKSWTQLTDKANKGLPAGPWGRVEIAIAPSKHEVVYALIESTASALYRSGDGGKTWERRDDSQMVVWRPFYFARLVVDPVNPDRLFKPDLTLVVSEDGGRSFSRAGGGSHGDWHDLWIDPTNPQHIIGGDDGGLWISYDGGSRWWKSNNLPISQFYHVAVDDRDPYQVYGGLQDNSSWVGDSSYPGGITNSRWEALYFGDGFWTVPDPSDPDAVYAEAQGGHVGRVDRKTHAIRDVQPAPNYNEKLRWNWNTPIYASPTKKGTIYLGAQFLFRSTDKGMTWQRISPDLTTNDPEKQKQEQSGGVTVDNSAAEMYTTIYSISESPKNANTIWVGTDDGNLQITRDAGKHWTNVSANVPNIDKGFWVNAVEASRYDANTAYATLDRHTYGDMNPYVYKTTDGGKSWTRLVGPGGNVRGYAHVIKEDSVDKDLLFLGTEFGLWVSIDGGAHWAAWKGKDFPSVAVHDLALQAREGDLVIATHGRGIWIIDDLSPLRALAQKVLDQQAAFLPARTTQQRMPADGGWVEGDATFVGENAPDGAVITYYQRTRQLFGPMKLEILDARGQLVDTLPPSRRRGLNRVEWSMRLHPPKVPRGAQMVSSAVAGPRVVPGIYTVRLTRGDQVLETKVEVKIDRRAPYSVADRRANFDAAEKAGKLFDDMSALSERIELARKASQSSGAKLPAGDPLAGKLATVAGKLEELRKKIVATKEGGAITGEERIREHLDDVYRVLRQWEGRPAGYQLQRIDSIARELGDVAKGFDEVVTKDIRPLDHELEQHKLAPLPTGNATSAREIEPSEEETMAALRCATSRGTACRVPTRVEAAAAERD